VREVRGEGKMGKLGVEKWERKVNVGKWEENVREEGKSMEIEGNVRAGIELRRLEGVEKWDEGKVRE
jgi:hypothetical protein